MFSIPFDGFASRVLYRRKCLPKHKIQLANTKIAWIQFRHITSVVCPLRVLISQFAYRRSLKVNCNCTYRYDTQIVYSIGITQVCVVRADRYYKRLLAIEDHGNLLRQCIDDVKLISFRQRGVFYVTDRSITFLNGILRYSATRCFQVDFAFFSFCIFAG